MSSDRATSELRVYTQPWNGQSNIIKKEESLCVAFQIYGKSINNKLFHLYMVYTFTDSLMRLEVSFPELFDSHLKVHDKGYYWRQEVGKGAVACEVETS